MSGQSPPRPAGVALVGVLAVVGAVAAVATRAPGSIAPPAVAAPGVEAPAQPTTVANPGGPGYVLMDLPAINRAVHGSGKPVLVHFWASWCGPCLEELPLVEKFARDMKARGLDVVSLSLDDPARAGARVVQVLSRSAPSLTRNIVQVADSDAFINSIDPKWEGAIPAMFAFDARGALRGRLIGGASRSDLDGLVARVRP